MWKIEKYLPAGVLSLAMLFTPAANAMQTQQFEKMDANDRGDYITAMVMGVHGDLEAQGNKTQADQLMTFFLDKSDNGGAHQFDIWLAKAKLQNQQDAANPNNQKPPVEVEHAMEVVLMKDGITTVPVTRLFEFTKNFQPKFPLKSGGSNSPPPAPGDK